MLLALEGLLVEMLLILFVMCLQLGLVAVSICELAHESFLLVRFPQLHQLIPPLDTQVEKSERVGDQSFFNSEVQGGVRGKAGHLVNFK